MTADCGDFRVRFYPSAMSSQLWYQPNYGVEDREVLRSCLRPGDTYVDVGANIGHLALLASKLVGPEGTVFAIEPHPRTFRYLLGNVRLNAATNFVPCNRACGNAEGTVRFSDIRSDDQNRVSECGMAVPVVCLDDLLRDVHHIRLVKVDVEGYEKFVFAGAQQVLRRTDYVYFEAWEHHCANYGYRAADIICNLHSLGFRVFRRDLSEVQPDYSAQVCENLLAVRSELEPTAGGESCPPRPNTT